MFLNSTQLLGNPNLPQPLNNIMNNQTSQLPLIGSSNSLNSFNGINNNERIYLGNFSNQNCQGPGASFTSCLTSVVNSLMHVIDGVKYLLSSVNSMFSGSTGQQANGVNSNQNPTLLNQVPSAGSGLLSSNVPTSNESNNASSTSWKDIIDIGSSILDVIGIFSSGGLSLFSKAGGLLKSGSGLFNGLIDKGMNFIKNIF